MTAESYNGAALMESIYLC